MNSKLKNIAILGLFFASYFAITSADVKEEQATTIFSLNGVTLVKDYKYDGRLLLKGSLPSSNIYHSEKLHLEYSENEYGDIIPEIILQDSSESNIYFDVSEKESFEKEWYLKKQLELKIGENNIKPTSVVFSIPNGKVSQTVCFLHGNIYASELEYYLNRDSTIKSLFIDEINYDLDSIVITIPNVGLYLE